MRFTLSYWLAGFIKKIPVKVLLYGLVMLIQINVFGQDPPFINYNEQNGLSTSVVYGLFQDSEDNIWFCTNSGAVKFNGNKLVPYKKKDGLAGNEVFKIFEDSQHRLWFMTASGQLSYYKNKTIFNACNHSVFSQLKIKSFISDIKEDKDNNIWIIPDRGNIYALSPDLKSFTEFTAQLFNSVFFSYKNANYISSKEGIYAISPQLSKVSFLNASASTLNARHFFFENFVYTGRSQKVEIYDMDTRIAGYFETPDLPQTLNSISVIDSLIYICSAKGLSLYNRRTHKKAAQYFSSINVSHVLKDKEGSLWISTLNEGVMYIPNMHVNFLKAADYFGGNKVLKLNGLGNHVIIGESNSKAKYYNQGLLKSIPSPNESRGEGRTYLIKVNKKDSAFIISNQSGLTQFSLKGMAKHIENIALLSYAESDDDSVYLSTPSIIGKFSKTLKEDYFTNTIKRYAFDSIRADVLYFDKTDSILYAGTRTGMLLYKNRTKIPGRFKKFNGLSFTDIDKSNLGVFVTTTLGDGVLFFKDDKLVQLNEQSGLTDNMCSGLFIQNDSTVWVTTLNGLNRIVYNYAAGVFKIKNLYRNDGLPSNYINDIYIYGDTVWLATNKGLAVFNEKDLSNYFYSPKMAIEAFKANDDYKPVFPSAHIKLDRNSNNIVIEFNCRTFKNAVSVLYKYKLVGLNSNWVETRNSQVDFTGLAPGKYEFAADHIIVVQLQHNLQRRALLVRYQLA